MYRYDKVVILVVRALQGIFSSLKYRLTSDKLKRKEIIGIIVLLHNFRTHYVGLNEIATFLLHI